MFDVITFGSATKDIFLRSKDFSVGDFKKDNIEKEILLPLGLKINIKEIYFRSGGGGTNTTATLSARGLKTAYCGVIGKDSEGEEILKELRKRGIETRFIFKTDKKPTDLSIIFSVSNERTILTYRGASQTLNKNKIPWSQIKKTKWLYLAPFNGKLIKVFKEITDFAQKNQIKLMVNPSVSQLKLPSKILKSAFKKIDILLLNEEEGQILMKNFSLKGEKLIKEIKRFSPGILIITNGQKKILVADRNYLYSALPPKIKVLDKTGAGDAFGAGFLSGYIKNREEIIPAVQLAIANAFFCIKKWGAKEGILRKNQEFKKVKVKKYEKS